MLETRWLKMRDGMDYIDRPWGHQRRGGRWGCIPWDLSPALSHRTLHPFLSITILPGKKNQNRMIRRDEGEAIREQEEERLKGMLWENVREVLAYRGVCDPEVVIGAWGDPTFSLPWTHGSSPRRKVAYLVQTQCCLHTICVGLRLGKSWQRKKGTKIVVRFRPCSDWPNAIKSPTW